MASLIQLALCVLIVAGMWVTFTKAGKPGWAAIVPFYNLWVATEIIKKPAVWFVIGLIPIVNILFCIEYAKAFGKGAGFGIGLALVPFVFYPMLAWGDATYQLGSKPGVAAAA